MDADEELQDDTIDSPLFNWHNREQSGGSVTDYQHFSSISSDDPNLPPPVFEAPYKVRATRCSVVSMEDLQNLQLEHQFSDADQDFDKSPEDAARIVREIKAVVLFEGCDDDELLQVTQFMYTRVVKPGEIVIQHGASADEFYVVKSGLFHCCKPESANVQNPIQVYDGHGYFGELALINRAPRAASITAMTAGALWVLRFSRHSWLRKRRAMANAEQLERVIQAIPLFRGTLDPTLTNRLIDAIETVNVPAGDVICRQGEPGDAMFFIVEGEVEARIDGKAVRTISKNEFFGERALVLDEVRAATCLAKTRARLAKLPKQSFNLLIPDLVIDSMRRYVHASYGGGSRSSSSGSKGRDNDNDGVIAEGEAKAGHKAAGFDDDEDDDDGNFSTASVYMEYLCQDLRK